MIVKTTGERKGGRMATRVTLLLVLVAVLLTGCQRGVSSDNDEAARHTDPEACTIFSASYGDTVLFASNLDHPNPDGYVSFRPASFSEYGCVLFGYYSERDGRVRIGYEGGMNEQGLAFDTNGLPDIPMNPHPEKPYSWRTVNFFHAILRQCASVPEAIAMANEFNFGNMMDFQVHLVDSTGDAVIISPGTDGELHFTRKEFADGYLVSTNFNRANTQDGEYPCWRYDTATNMLEKVKHEDDLTPAHFQSILDAVHREGSSYNTILSYITDVKSGVVYLYHFHQFEEVFRFNLEEELGRGRRELRVADLFSQETVDRASGEYQGHQTRERIVEVAALIAVPSVTGGLMVFVYRKVRKRR